MTDKYDIDGKPEAMDAKAQKAQEAELNRLREIVARMSTQTREYVVPTGRSNELRFAIGGDMQVGSLYERMDAFALFIEAAIDFGATDLLIPGDILDGLGNYKGQIFEQYARGFDEQLEALCDKMPHDKATCKLRMAAITGNHDLTYKKSMGADVGKHIEAAMQKLGLNFTMLGDEVGDVVFKTRSGRPYRVRLFHPGGGTAYAISYKMQKAINALSGGQKPDMLAEGHYHKANLLPQYRNIVGVDTGCFQSQTPFMARAGSPAHVGGWLMKPVISKAEHFTSRLSSEFLSFYEPSGEVK